MIRLRTSAAALCLFVLVGCAPKDPLDLTVSAQTQADYGLWLNHEHGALSPLQAKHYEKAMNEIRLFSVTEWQGRPVAEQAEHVLAQIDGLPVRAIISQGYLLANKRIDTELGDDRRLLGMYQRLLATPSKPEEIRAMRMNITQIAERIAMREAEIAENNAVIELVSRGLDPRLRELQKKTSL